MQALEELYLKNGFMVKKSARKKFSLKDTEKAFIQCEVVNKNKRWAVTIKCPDTLDGTKVSQCNYVLHYFCSYFLPATYCNGHSLDMLSSVHGAWAWQLDLKSICVHFSK